MTDYVQKALDEQDWEAHLQMLILFTRKYIRRLRWRGIEGAPLPGGGEAEDLALDAIEDVLTGVRAWNPDVHPDLAAHLRWVVKSKVSNLVRRRANTSEVRIDDLPPDEEPGGEDEETWAWEFFASLESEPLLSQIVDAIMEGVTGRQDIADHLGITPSEFSNARKQLQRRLTNYRQSPETGPSTRKKSNERT